MIKIIKENINNIYILLFWCIIIFLCSTTLKKYSVLISLPLWDNLAYQNEALEILRNWLSGKYDVALRGIMDSQAPAHAIYLAINFLLFGFNTISPYIGSALFGFGCIVSLYVLAIELGASKRAALWGGLFYSITPNFIYQNFLQSRNDFEVAFLMTTSWILYLRGIKEGKNLLGFYSGIIIGIAVLFKASTPGYIIFWVIIIYFIPKKYINLRFTDKAFYCLSFTVGVLIACGWHYFGNIRNIIEYYRIWSTAESWKAWQYQLDSNLVDYLFYPKNIIFTHFSIEIIIIISIILLIIIVRSYYINHNSAEKKLSNENYFPIFLTLLNIVIPLIFISINKSFASVGDIPIILMIISIIIAIVYKKSEKLYVKNSVLIILLVVSFTLSMPSIKFIERNTYAKDLSEFYNAITIFRKNYGLKEEEILQIYSHPLYNVDIYRWMMLIDPNFRDAIPNSLNRKITNILFPEEPSVIANKLIKIPLIITSKFSGEVIGGESFHTFNRLHESINREINESQQFIKINDIHLEDNKFPIQLLLNKNYSKLSAEHVTSDNWVLWNSNFEFFSYLPSKILWRGIPRGNIQEFQLKGADPSEFAIRFKYKGIGKDGVPEFESNAILGATKLRHYKLVPGIIQSPMEITNKDLRELAFYKLEVKIEKLSN